MNMTGGGATSKNDEYLLAVKEVAYQGIWVTTLVDLSFQSLRKKTCVIKEENILRKPSLTSSFHTIIFLER